VVATPGTQILIGASIGANATNLYSHLASTPFASTTLVRSGTNAVRLIATDGTAVTASLTGTWGEITYATNATTSAKVLRIPLSIESASVQTNLATLLVEEVFNTPLSQVAIGASSTVLANFVDTSENQTVGGVKTFTGNNVHSGSSQRYEGGSVSNVTARVVKVPYATTYTGLWFYDNGGNLATAIVPDTLGIPSLYEHVIASDTFTTAHAVTPQDQHILNVLSGDYRYGKFSGENSWTGTNTFSRITNSTIVNSTITGTTFSGTIGTLANGTITSPTIQSGVNRVAAFQSYINSSSNLELGSAAEVVSPSTSGVAVGENASVAADDGTALGSGATADYANSTAIGAGATTTAANQVRLGTSSEYVSAPNDVHVADNLSVGSAAKTFVASLAKGIELTDGTAASANPSAGAAIWSASGSLQYRTSGSSEGDGGTKYMHNRAAETIGSGSAYTLTGSYALLNFGSTPLTISLPTAGTYRIAGIVCYTESGAGGGDQVYFHFYNSTDASTISGSERSIGDVAASQTSQIVLENIVTVTGAKTIQVRGYNATSARGSTIAGLSSLNYIRLF
jgi:hypothetical protein